MCGKDIQVTIPIKIAYRDSHICLLLAIITQRHATLYPNLFECAVLLIDEEQIRR